MTKHIGIVGCSAEGAALCYRTICLEGAEYLGMHSHPEVTLHTHPLSEYMKFIYEDRWDGVANLMLSSAEKLKKAGAEFLICPDNTIHQAFEHMLSRSPLPWLHIAVEVAREASGQKMKHLGILGTRYLMEGPVYPGKLSAMGIKYTFPDEPRRKRINSIIFDELVNGKFTEESHSYFHHLIDELRDQGCDGVVLGCTEIPLIVSPKESSLPTLDSTRLLARAALLNALR
ncbi:MAG: aspartate racemase [Acidobacteria bacterium]|nr:MAG: aspartate racemase [Acidobacteriota bacterium]